MPQFEAFIFVIFHIVNLYIKIEACDLKIGFYKAWLQEKQAHSVGHISIIFYNHFFIT